MPDQPDLNLQDDYFCKHMKELVYTQRTNDMHSTECQMLKMTSETTLTLRLLQKMSLKYLVSLSYFQTTMTSNFSKFNQCHRTHFT